MPITNISQYRSVGGALVNRPAAAFPERAAMRKIDQVGRLAFDRVELLFSRQVQPGYRVQESQSVGVAGVPIYISSRAALYYSCIARGPNLFGDGSVELGTIKDALGDVPLVGFFANGEICNNRLYGYTGVLTLFT